LEQRDGEKNINRSIILGGNYHFTSFIHLRNLLKVARSNEAAYVDIVGKT